MLLLPPIQINYHSFSITFVLKLWQLIWVRGSAISYVYRNNNTATISFGQEIDAPLQQKQYGFVHSRRLLWGTERRPFFDTTTGAVVDQFANGPKLFTIASRKNIVSKNVLYQVTEGVTISKELHNRTWICFIARLSTPTQLVEYFNLWTRFLPLCFE